MKILITGSEGFIGKHLCRALSEHEVIEIDLKTGNDILDCELPEADIVYHLAAQTDARSLDVVQDAKVNVVGLIRVLEHFKSKVVFTSSSAVKYPVTPYGISKLAGEYYCRLYGASIVRLCNVHGPGGHGVFEAFEKSKELIIAGDGSQVRTYCHVSKVIERLCDQLVKRTPFDILHGDTMTVLDVADKYPDKPRIFVPASNFDLFYAPQLLK